MHGPREARAGRRLTLSHHPHWGTFHDLTCSMARRLSIAPRVGGGRARGGVWGHAPQAARSKRSFLSGSNVSSIMTVCWFSWWQLEAGGMLRVPSCGWQLFWVLPNAHHWHTTTTDLNPAKRRTASAERGAAGSPFMKVRTYRQQNLTFPKSNWTDAFSFESPFPKDQTTVAQNPRIIATTRQPKDTTLSTGQCAHTGRSMNDHYVPR